MNLLEVFGLGVVSRLAWEPVRRYFFEDRLYGGLFPGPSRWIMICQNIKTAFSANHESLPKVKVIDSLKDVWQTVWKWREPPWCYRCNRLRGLLLEDSRTQYHQEGKISPSKDKNKPILYCRECASMHHDYWDDMWADYYGSRL